MPSVQMEREPEGSPWKRRIVSVTPVPNTKTGNVCGLECGHTVITFGSLDAVAGTVVCTACRDEALSIWTITFNPSDFPGRYVVRRSLCTATGVSPTTEFSVHETLDQARAAVPPGLACLGREPDDYPVIVESWM